MNASLNNECLTEYRHHDNGHTSAVFDNGDGFTVTSMQPAGGAMCFIVVDAAVKGPEREFVVTINFDFYGVREEHESAAEITGIASEFVSVNYLDAHYLNQYVADRKANLITTCALHEAKHNV